MSVHHIGARPSFQHEREAAGQTLGAGAAARAKGGADAAFKDLRSAKAALACQQAAEAAAARAAAAKESMGAARGFRQLDAAFAAAVRNLKR